MPFARFEDAEADAWLEIQTSVSAEFRDRFDVGVERVAGVVVITAPRTDMMALNRAWLPGRHPEATRETLDAIMEHARSRGVKRLIVHCPSWASPAGFPLLQAHPVGPMVKLFRRADVVPEHESTLRIVRAKPAERQLFGTIAALGNEGPPFMADGFNSTVGQPGWIHYIAFDEDIPVAAAAVRLRAGVAWACFAGTIPEYRGRGAQRALLAQRIRDAASAGCEWVTCEALPDPPNGRSYSLANMLAMGFSRAYERPSFVIDLEGTNEGRKIR